MAKNEVSGKRAKLNKATQGQFYKICEWVKYNKVSVLEARPTKADLAARITREIGFTVSPSTIPSVQETVGIKWVPKMGPRVPHGQFKYSPQRMEGNIRLIANAVMELYKQLGQPVPESLTNMVSPITMSSGLDYRVAGLVRKCVADDSEAMEELRALAYTRGWSHDDIDGADAWDDVAVMALNDPPKTK